MSITSIQEYQRQTVYSRERVPPQGMDLSNQPSLWREYDAPLVSLSRELSLPRVEAARILAGLGMRAPRKASSDDVARLLFLAYSITDQVDYQGQPAFYRSAPSAGALYPVDLFLAAAGLPGLDDGLHYYSPMDFALAGIAKGACASAFLAPSLVIGATFFRSGWKYRDRALRYCLLDAGHVLENLVLACRVLGLESHVISDFDDQAIAHGLGLDPLQEGPVAILSLENQEEAPLAEETSYPTPLQAAPVAAHATEFELVTQAVQLSSARVRQAAPAPFTRGKEPELALTYDESQDLSGPSFVACLRSRRSRRNFKPQVLSLEQLARFLNLLLPVEPDFVSLGLATNGVKELAEGYYRLQAAPLGLSLAKGGFIQPAISRAALHQDWLSRTNLTLVISADLGALEERHGPRALRVAYLEAGRIGQRAYLAAETMGWGCTGVGAFFDEELAAALGMEEKKSPLYLLALGPVKKRTHGGRPDEKNETP